MTDYCDTNILTAFVNKDELRKNFGTRGINRFKDIKRFRSEKVVNKLLKLNKCAIDKDALFSDIGNHQASMGAVLTSKNLRSIEIKEINGLEEGKKIYNSACHKVDRNKKFYKKFCDKGILKEIFSKSEFNDIRHFGSAIKSGSENFITDNKKDFQELNNLTEVKIV